MTNMCYKITLLFIFLFSFLANAQEICNNCIDDDNDGMIDCYDTECYGNLVDCPDFFIEDVIAAKECVVFQEPTPVFPYLTTWENTTLTGYGGSTNLVAGDIDGDGIAELVLMRKGVPDIVILDGQTGAVELSFPIPPIWTADDWANITLALADVDKDGDGEILYMAIDSFSLATFIYCYEHTGVLKWQSDTIPYGDWFLGKYKYFRGPLGFADFDANDTAEVYVGNL